MRAPKTGRIAVSRVIAGELARELAEYVQEWCQLRPGLVGIRVLITKADFHDFSADFETGWTEDELHYFFGDALENYVRSTEPGLSAGSLRARVLILSGEESVLLASIDPDHVDDFRAELVLLADNVATDDDREVYTFGGREIALLRGGLK